MNSLRAEIPSPTTGPFVLPFYYGWVNVAVAALAMVGTLPGRTQGLGLITESLLADLQMIACSSPASISGRRLLERFSASASGAC